MFVHTRGYRLYKLFLQSFYCLIPPMVKNHLLKIIQILVCYNMSMCAHCYNINIPCIKWNCMVFVFNHNSMSYNIITISSSLHTLYIYFTIPDFTKHYTIIIIRSLYNLVICQTCSIFQISYFMCNVIDL